MPDHAEIEYALEVFVRGFSAEKSRTYPYEHFRSEEWHGRETGHNHGGRETGRNHGGQLWVMRDAERKNAKDYRKEEWIAYRVPPAVVDAAARQQTRGRYFVCALSADAAGAESLRDGYMALGYRLLATETLFIHPLKRISRAKPGVADGSNGKGGSKSITIEQVKTTEMAARFGKVTRTRPIPAEKLGKEAPFRQYVALDEEQIVGWVRSVDAADSTWCSNMYVQPTYRRRGIGKVLLTRMLQDDRRLGSRNSVLLSSHAGALLYPHVGYEALGTLFIFALRRR